METLLFQTNNYSRHGRNPLEVHGTLAEKTPLEPQHFRRWLEIFNQSVDELFSGEPRRIRKGASLGDREPNAELRQRRAVYLIRQLPDKFRIKFKAGQLGEIGVFAFKVFTENFRALIGVERFEEQKFKGG